MADVVSERLRLAAGSLTKQTMHTEAFTDKLLAQLGIAAVCTGSAPQGNHSRGGQLAAPAPGGLYGDESGHEPPLAVFEAELAELLNHDTEKGGEEQPLEPRQLRRVAELVELLNGEPAAKPWWRRAATAGDGLARKMCDLHVATPTEPPGA